MWSVDPSTLSNTNKTNQCGNSASAELDHYVSIDLPAHTSPSMTLRVSSTIHQGAADEWWAITDVLLSPLADRWPAIDTFETVSERGDGKWVALPLA